MIKYVVRYGANTAEFNTFYRAFEFVRFLREVFADRPEYRITTVRVKG